MSKTIALRTELQRLFKTLTSNVYYDIALDTAPYPYLVYELSELTFDYGKTLIELEVNIFDYGSSSSAVEILADTLQETLNKYYFINDKIQFTVYKASKNKIEEEDKNIIRRRLTFEIQLHELKGE